MAGLARPCAGRDQRRLRAGDRSVPRPTSEAAGLASPDAIADVTKSTRAVARVPRSPGCWRGRRHETGHRVHPLSGSASALCIGGSNCSRRSRWIRERRVPRQAQPRRPLDRRDDSASPVRSSGRASSLPRRRLRRTHALSHRRLRIAPRRRARPSAAEARRCARPPSRGSRLHARAHGHRRRLDRRPIPDGA